MISEKRVFEDPLWIVAAILAIFFIAAIDLPPEAWELKTPDLSNPVIWFLLIIVAALGLFASRSDDTKMEKEKAETSLNPHAQIFALLPRHIQDGIYELMEDNKA